MPACVKYTGVATEAFQRITVLERENGSGRSMWVSMLYCSEHAEPNYLAGLCMSVQSEGRHDISCVRMIWHYLGKAPNLRNVLSKCGIVDKSAEKVPDIILEGTNNSMRKDELILSPRI